MDATYHQQGGKRSVCSVFHHVDPLLEVKLKGPHGLLVLGDRAFGGSDAVEEGVDKRICILVLCEFCCGAKASCVCN